MVYGAVLAYLASNLCLGREFLILMLIVNSVSISLLGVGASVPLSISDPIIAH